MAVDFLTVLPFVAAVYVRSRSILAISMFAAAWLSEIFSSLPFGVSSFLIIGSIAVMKYALAVFDSESTPVLLLVFFAGFLAHGTFTGAAHYFYRNAALDGVLLRSLIFVAREFIASVFIVFLFLSLFYSYLIIQNAFSPKKIQ